MLIQMLVHIKAIPQQMRLMAPSLAHTLKLGLVKVIFQDRHVVRMRAFLDDDARPLFGRQTAHVCESLLSDDDVEIVLGLVNVRAHGHDAGNASGIGFRGTGRGRMHDRVFCRAQKVCTTAEAVEHAAAHYAGRICVCVDIDFDGSIHADDTEAADDFRRVGDLLGAQEQLGSILVPVFVEAVETVGREADGCCGGEVEVSRVEEVEERVLEHFGPYFEVFEVCAARLRGVF